MENGIWQQNVKINEKPKFGAAPYRPSKTGQSVSVLKSAFK
jgi:hypothetical protein